MSPADLPGAEATGPLQVDSPAPAGIGVALLVVDDNDDNRYTLTRRLRREGYDKLTTANDGNEALERLRAGRFDLVLLDIMMPGLDGYQVLAQMKVDPELRDIPVIMISAADEIESIARCIDLGAEDFLSKPFNATLLRARVGASLEKKRLRDAVRASLARLELELDAARSQQLEMLPRNFPVWSAVHPVRLHAYMEPAREVGGDLYDFFYRSDNSLCFLVGDVSGKGAPAAMFMARTRSLVRLAVDMCQRYAPDDCNPQTIARAVNRELCQDNANRMFVTLFLGFLDMHTGRLSFINAGHPQPYQLSAGGAIQRIKSRAQLPLGVRSDFAYQAETLQLDPGDALFVCSDGVAEATDEALAFYTDARIETELLAGHADTPAAMIGRMHDSLSRFTGAADRADDVTMMALRWEPAAA